MKTRAIRWVSEVVRSNSQAVPTRERNRSVLGQAELAPAASFLSCKSHTSVLRMVWT